MLFVVFIIVLLARWAIMTEDRLWRAARAPPRRSQSWAHVIKRHRIRRTSARRQGPIPGIGSLGHSLFRTKRERVAHGTQFPKGLSKKSPTRLARIAQWQSARLVSEGSSVQS